jgi:Ca2+-binding EF-hand superfamily protein
MPERNFNAKDFEMIIRKIFSSYDKDHNGRFTRDEFFRVIRSLIGIVGGDEASY